ncbi:MAG: KEOPS complex subunit Pcc1 [Candidatus Aenigmarchaeota archaeon]|nr:KEOPS complex subunit Pcc1 [Candidatus Aenigmarchaeota archaeon]MCX8179357.1 KEOPS complex subunit Pcc1 [Candidatus Aenigmarchaeota archaeon]
MKVILEIASKNAESIRKSLEPDAKSNENVKIKFKNRKDKLLIEIEGDKIGHIKGIINSYLTLINVLKEMGE